MTMMLALAATLAGAPSEDGPQKVEVYRDERGFKLQVDGEDTMVFGMNWDYFPVGTNYNFNFWGQPEPYIREALKREMTLMKEMGVNSIRVYTGIPKKWITHIYDEYGIFTILNHSMGRYGFFVDGTYVDPIDYSNPAHRDAIAQEIYGIVREYKDTRGLMFWLLGNENNYGLFWASAEVENLPLEQQGEARAKHLYSLYGEIISGIKRIDDNHPVAIANGDLQFIDLIAKYCPELDIMGSNVYRGPSSGALFQDVLEKLDVPFVYTEFGSDAYNAKLMREADIEQAELLRDLWQEIYEHSYGLGRAQNAIGGMTFQWTDGWWKTGQTVDLSVHNTRASWSNRAYMFDWTPDGNNMNEEWFGITAKTLSDADGLYNVKPRTAYYLLKEGYRLDPYAVSSIEQVREHWSRLEPKDFADTYRIDRLEGEVNLLKMVRAVEARIDLETISTGGNGLEDPDGNEQQFDHLQSFYFGFGLQPAPNVTGRVSFNALGNIPTNPINPIFFENRGDADPEDIERIQVYQAEFEWESEYFDLEGFYRTRHYHWGYEGDYFGLYQEANYPSVPMAAVEGVDTFNQAAPVGVEFAGKKFFDGLKIAIGPQLYWGANPGIIGKYYRELGKLDIGIVHQEDFAQISADSTTSSVLPLPQTRKTALSLGYKTGDFQFKFGGLMAGTDRLDQSFTTAREATGPGNGFAGSGFDLFDDTIDWIDTLGAKAKVVYTGQGFSAYVHGAYKGLVADGFGDPTDTITGWILDEPGQGNHYSAGGGVAVQLGYFQVAPNFIFQKPLEGPLSDEDGNPIVPTVVDSQGARVFSGVNLRNQFDDPFWVRANREMIAGELLIAFDPTPATWMWAWDNMQQEDAKISGFIDFVYRHHPTSLDSGAGVLQDGTFFAFGGAAPARDLWEVTGRVMLVPRRDLRMSISGYGGIVQTTGSDDRLVERVGTDIRMLYRRLDVTTFLKFNDWGPYDFQRDFNLTFPFQLGLETSYGLKAPEWFTQVATNIGLRFLYRTLDEFSDGVRIPSLDAQSRGEAASGNEWEIRTFVQIAI